MVGIVEKQFSICNAGLSFKKMSMHSLFPVGFLGVVKASDTALLP